MGSAESIKYVYIFAGSEQEFLQYMNSIGGDAIKEESNTEYLMIQDETFLRGRAPGEIRKLEGRFTRWDYEGIEQSCERYEKIWKEEFGYSKELGGKDDFEDGLGNVD